jgi:hypothetical protein
MSVQSKSAIFGDSPNVCCIMHVLAPLSVNAPTVDASGIGQRIAVAWDPPNYNTGIITMYVVKAYIDLASAPIQTSNVSGTTFKGDSTLKCNITFPIVRTCFF